MDVIIKLRNRLECKINYTLLALLPNKVNTMRQGPVTSGENIRSKRAIPALAIIQGVAAIGRMMIKGIHRQYVRYELALDNTLIRIENLNSGYLTHCILDPKILGKYLEAVKDNLDETAPEFEPVFTSVYQYYGNSLISFTNMIDDLLLRLPILIKLKVQVPMSLFSIETVPVP